MNQLSSFQPKWASPPGDTIADILSSRNISVDRFAELMQSTSAEMQQLLYGRIYITDDIAYKLKEVIGASKDFWIRREQLYRSRLDQLKHTEEDKWIKKLPVKDMQRLGWINKDNNVKTECLKFFDVPDVWVWQRQYGQVSSSIAFRRSTTFESDPASVITWIRYAEIKGAAIECKKWDQNRFRRSLTDMRRLTKKKDPKEFVPELRALCANAGVALVIARTPQKCPASGATKFITPEKAMILLSFRHNSDDQFWFTFFHEAGHLLLHSHGKIFVEGDAVGNIEEEEANRFAEEILIPSPWQARLRAMPANQHEIKKLAKDADISLGIIVGQLQHLKRLNPAYLNGFKRKYDLDDIMAVSQ